MDVIEIKKLSSEGEEELNANLNDSLDVPQGSIETGKTFKREDVLKCFEKPFAISESIYLVGSTCTHPEGNANDVDIIVTSNLPEDMQKSIRFRMYRAFADFYNIPYDDTPKYLQIEFKKEGSSAFTNHVSLYKIGLIPTPNDERTIRKMSLSDEIDDTEIEILEKSKDFIIGGIVSDTSEDLEQERITPKALKQIWESIQKTPEEFRGLFDSHNSTCVGSLIMNYKKYRCALIDDSKLFLIFKLRQDMPIAQKIIKAIKSGELKSFSIKFGIKNPKKNIKEICDEENQCVTEILGGTYYIETSLTPNPSNKNTSLEILNK